MALRVGYALGGFIDPRKAGGTLLGRPILAKVPPDGGRLSSVYAIGIGDNFRRHLVAERMLATHPLEQFPVIVDPSVVISQEANIAQGTVVMAGTVLGVGATVGRFCIINTSCALDHDSTVADYASLAPGVVTGGDVKIGFRSFVGLGAAIRHGALVGSDTVIGARSYVHTPLPDRVVAYGAPARVVRNRTPEQTYL